MNAKPILYSYYRSSCSWRVRTALALKGVDYVYKAVNLISIDGGQQHSSEFREINPLSQVPALVINNNDVLIESMAIIDYINEVYSGPSLLPNDPILRAKSRAIAEMITSGIQPLQNSTVLKKVGEAGNADLGDKAEWAKYWISLKFDALEKLLSKTSGKCCVGDEITIADICLVPQVFNAHRFGIDTNQFPIINRINKHLLQNKAFIESHPHKQPDCPPELKNVF
jgi:maleylacetoacetate isomerase